MERKTAWNEYKKKDMKKLEKLNAGYRAFLDNGKTERECVQESAVSYTHLTLPTTSRV